MPEKNESAINSESATNIDSGGRIVIPAAYRSALGLKPGDTVILRLTGNELRLFSRRRAVQRAQEIVRRYVPPDVSLVDDLLRERRRERRRAKVRT